MIWMKLVGHTNWKLLELFYMYKAHIVVRCLQNNTHSLMTWLKHKDKPYLLNGVPTDFMNNCLGLQKNHSISCIISCSRDISTQAMQIHT
jgi:hypothetical protein